MVRRPRSSNLAPPWLRERLVTCFLQEPQGGEAGVRITLLVPSPASSSPSWGTSLASASVLTKVNDSVPPHGAVCEDEMNPRHLASSAKDA